MLQLSEFVWILRSSGCVVFNNFLLIDVTDRSKINSDQKWGIGFRRKPFYFSRTLPEEFFHNTAYIAGHSL